MKIEVAIQGVKGSYSEEAARKFCAKTSPTIWTIGRHFIFWKIDLWKKGVSEF